MNSGPMGGDAEIAAMVVKKNYYAKKQYFHCCLNYLFCRKVTEKTFHDYFKLLFKITFSKNSK